jgi:hypothetical protein
MDNGTLLIYTYHGQANQRFLFEPYQGKYRIKSVASGKYVRVTNDAEQDNMWIRVDPAGNKSEIWDVVPAIGDKYKGKSGYYHIRSFNGKAITAPSANN